MNDLVHSTWAEIDFRALESNVRLVRKITSTSIMAVVKANAYGHGAVPTAKAALRGGAEWLAVARPEEGLQLRHAGLKAPILILGYTPPAMVNSAISHNLSMTVWKAEQVDFAAEEAARIEKYARLHLKVDTGMNRLGVSPNETEALAHKIKNQKGVILEGIFTHFARADERDTSPTDKQANIFHALLDRLEENHLLPQWVHAANSAAALVRPNERFSLVRLGIAMYGLHPSQEIPLPHGFSPVLSWKAVLSHVKTVPPGSGISYGHRYVTKGYERIGTIPVGYADGYRRLDGNIVLIGGKRAPVIGRVCMDQIMVQLDSIPDAKAGDEVVLIGIQGDEHISAEEVANIWGTINYEVVCAIGARVPRIFIEEAKM